MKTILLILLSFLLVSSWNAQDFAWVKMIDNDGTPTLSIPDVQVDEEGNIYTIGVFSGEIDLDPNIDELLYTTTTNDMFIQKLNPQGEVMWVKVFAGEGGAGVGSFRIVDDHIYIFGVANDSFDFDPNEGEEFIETSGSDDVFILKLNMNAEFVWVRSFGSGGSDRILGMDLDEQGNIYSMGFFYGNVDFDPGIESSVLSSGGLNTKALFIQKLGNEGNFIWAKRFVGYFSMPYLSNYLEVYQNHVVLSGNFRYQTDFNPGAAQYYLGDENDEEGDLDMFIVQLSTDGTFEWARQMDCTEDASNCHVIKVNGNNEIVSISEIKGVTHLSPNYENILIDTGNNKDLIVQKMDSEGHIIWNKIFESIHFSQNDYDLAINDNNDLFIHSFFIDSLDFDPNEGVEMRYTNPSKSNFILNLGNDGDFQWVHQVDLLGFGSIGNLHRNIAVDNNGNVYTSGIFLNSADFNPGGLAVEVHCNSHYSGATYLLKLSPCVHLQVDTIDSCEPYTWIDGNTYSDNIAATYYLNETSASSCDSIATLVYRTNHANTYIHFYDDDNHFLSHEYEGPYQWYECNDDEMILIEGETSQSFYPDDVDGYYALEIDQHGCSVFTDCVSLNSVNVEEIQNENNLQIYPNPSSGNITIELSKNNSNNQIRILNAMGKLIEEKNTIEAILHLDLSKYPSGLYFIQVINERNVVQNKRVVLER